jgi:hypothetical protein
LKESYRRIFDTPDGEIVLRHICRHAHVFGTTFVKGDPYETALREGERRLALSILRFIYREDRSVELIEKGLTEHEDNEHITA